MDIQTKKLAEGITLYMLPDGKFKNCVQGIYFSMPLQKETATTLALLPKLLTAGNAHFEDRTALNMQLETLYGARFRAGAEKLGEVHTISFVGDCIADAYAGEDLFSKMQALMQTVICQPKIKDAAFDAGVVSREREALREDIKGVVNDKRRYALVRCSEEMCKDEPYGCRADGREEDLDTITPESAYTLYQKMLQTAQVDIFITGAFDVEKAEKGARMLADVLGDRTGGYPKTTRKRAGEVQYVEDKEAVLQGKLVIGYRTDIDSASDEYYALLVYNAVFGGGTSSKLFNNVREKMSLCYYASSALERTKGLLFVQSGIEFSKYKVALDAIIAQGEEIASGTISDAEFSGAVQGICNQLRSYKDSPSLLMGYYRRQLPTGRMTDIDLEIEKIMAVKPEQIPAVARQIHMDTVYFLNGTGGEEK